MDKISMILMNPIKLFVFLVATILGGCSATRTIYVPSGEPVRLAKTVNNWPVWVMGADKKEVLTKMTLPEGHYVIEDTRDKK